MNLPHLIDPQAQLQQQTLFGIFEIPPQNRFDLINAVNEGVAMDEGALAVSLTLQLQAK